MDVGARIREFRLERGLSQGDIEKKTKLLRCYLSRVENGHTKPSLETLSKIAHALELPLARFFPEDEGKAAGRVGAGGGEGRLGVALPKVPDEELRFVTQMRKYAAGMGESDKKLLLAMARKFAGGAA